VAGEEQSEGISEEDRISQTYRQREKIQMIVATRASLNRAEIGNGDIRIVHTNRTWEQFQHLQQGFENTRGMRLAYFNGTIEIIMPGKPHELFKSVIAILIEAFLLDRELEFEPTGSMTQQLEGEVSVEADESYQIDDLKLSIEVNFTSGGIAKLEYYRALGVNEVWMWEDGVLDIYHLQSTGYEKVDRSLIPALAALDLTVLSACISIGETSRVAAVKKFRAAHS
jgi:Uma2 family endonuclease